MGEVVNLRRARKARDRGAATAQADANRRRFGRTAAEKQAEAAETARREAVLDGARIGDQASTDSSAG